MFRDLLIVGTLLLVMVGTVVAVVFGGVLGLTFRHTHVAAVVNDPPPDLSSASFPATAPTTQPTEAAEEETPAPHFDSIELWAKDAKLYGGISLAEVDLSTKYSKGRSHWSKPQTPINHLTGFRTGTDYAEWPLEVAQAGEYEISVSFACAKYEKTRFVLKVADNELPCSTQGIGSQISFRVVSIGKLVLPAGKTTVELRATPHTGEAIFMNVRKIELIPTTTAKVGL